jgi:hypothetical protein
VVIWYVFFPIWYVWTNKNLAALRFAAAFTKRNEVLLSESIFAKMNFVIVIFGSTQKRPPDFDFARN